ncbi:hypothetical protein BKD30_08920 [Tersicoccus phoenicis]|uniref:DUF308 domain-containing protein n=1 Tax=Tersicoccus phoenicis TaxID=554083 RepID=A0A1R1L9S1_9MICC|nr:hypothetical protein [Tersicoccus phoenicis]OMH24253.1 hypothetical protein BKD30_08920 [Tersicoccus phoenicis]
MSDPRAVEPSRPDDEAAWQDLVRRFHESGPASHESGPAPGPRDHVVDEPDEDFEPPEPAPLSSAEPALALAWTGVVVSLGLLLVVTVFLRPAPSVFAWALAGLFVISAGYLAYRLPRERHDDDDGARV